MNVAEQLHKYLLDMNITIGTPILGQYQGLKIIDTIKNSHQFTINEASESNILLLVKGIVRHGPNIKFIELILPKSLEVAQIERFDTVIVRYLKDFVIGTDKYQERWDVLIEKM